MTQGTIKKPKITLALIFSMLQNIATREEVQAIVKEELKNYPTKEDFSYDLSKHPTNFDIDEKLTKLKSDFYDKIDPIIREIEDNREDRTLSTHKFERVDNTLVLHHKRLTKLEQH